MSCVTLGFLLALPVCLAVLVANDIAHSCTGFKGWPSDTVEIDG